MALFATYAAWITGIRDWIETDEYSDAQIATFLSMAHIRLNTDLRSSRMEGKFSFTVSAPEAGLPVDIYTKITDFNKIRLVIPNVGENPAESITIEEYVKKVADDPSGDPSSDEKFYCMDAGQINFYPPLVEGNVVDIRYFVTVPELGVGTDTNIFSIYHANILLLASCMEAAPYMVEDERLPIWRQQYDQLVADINGARMAEKAGSTSLRRRPKGLK